MKKKNLKSLSLKKSSVSNLNGGAANRPIQLTRNLIECAQTYDIRDCTWYSELYTACDCQPSWDLGCQLSVDIPCEA